MTTDDPSIKRIDAMWGLIIFKAIARFSATRIIFSPFFLFPIVSLILVAACAMNQKYVPQGGDNVNYLMAARYWPDFAGHLQESWGWGYPAIIRLLSPIFPDERAAGLAVSVLATPFVVLFTVALAFRFLPPAYAWGMSAIAATHPLLIRQGSVTHTEMLFTVLIWSMIWLLFLRKNSFLAVGLAGVLTAFACCVRGNALGLALAVPIMLMLEGKPGLRRAAVFGLGGVACFLLLMCLFFATGAPFSRFLPHGAGNLAFAALDEDELSDSFHRAEFSASYPTMTSLFFNKPWEMTRAAAKSMFHLYDWWLLPAFGILGFFTVPGFLAWLRRWKLTHLGLTGTVLALQFTYIWHAKYGTRYLVPAFPFLLLLSMYGFLILPKRVRFKFGVTIPLRGIIAILVIIPTLGYSTLTIARALISPAPKRVIDQNEAGLWLKTHSDSGDRLAASKETIAYCAHVLEIDHLAVFGNTTPQKDQIAEMLRAKNCRWLAWIKGHSAFEFGDSTWLETENSFGECELVFRNEHVSIWEVKDGRNKLGNGPQKSLSR